MNAQQVEDIFDFYGLSPIYNQFRYRFEVFGLFDSISTELLEDFLDTYTIEALTFQEFHFLFLSFKHIYAQLPFAHHYSN
ncbi:hypothetical protein [Metabacillus iocasae]|uniref:Uncharacterized protein n=1 Tax=Priestia iocasae TaxID=2291674 RepID=A0ABS2QRQ7_9BACI|nr:hypothetical protein [Metabacillus iocasae]MBM7701978.1 hypothetical protein [Metabacillus iocasae]